MTRTETVFVCKNKPSKDRLYGTIKAIFEARGFEITFENENKKTRKMKEEKNDDSNLINSNRNGSNNPGGDCGNKTN